jgi:hypothetical protein
MCSDTTIEKLAEILEVNPRGVLVARDALAGWLGSFQSYKGDHGGSDLSNWLEMHRAGTVVVDRKTGDRRTLFIRPATVSVTGGIQLGVLVRYLTPKFLESGLAARLLRPCPCHAKKLVGDGDRPRHGPGLRRVTATPVRHRFRRRRGPSYPTWIASQIKGFPEEGWPGRRGAGGAPATKCRQYRQLLRQGRAMKTLR